MIAELNDLELKDLSHNDEFKIRKGMLWMY